MSAIERPKESIFQGKQSTITKDLDQEPSGAFKKAKAIEKNRMWVSK